MREEAVERVGHGSKRQDVEATPSLILLQDRIVADIEAETARVDQQLGERGDVAYAEVQALTGDRMDRVRRFADERQSRSDVGFCDHQREWVRPTRPDWLDSAKEIPEPGGEFLREGALAELHYPRRKFGSFR